MPEADDLRYDELFAALYSGIAPDWIMCHERHRLQLAADGYRLSVCTILGSAFPRASFYAAACCGSAVLDGVSRCLLDLPSSDQPFAAKVARAALNWCRQTEVPELVSMFEYDDLVRPPLQPYEGANREVFVRVAALPDSFSLKEFGHDVLGFVTLIDRFRDQFAPPEVVRRYSPATRAQLVAAYFDGDRIRVREVPL